ncbi:MAG: hypothetical protein PGN09_00805 [Sphingomonas fennica]
MVIDQTGRRACKGTIPTASNALPPPIEQPHAARSANDRPPRIIPAAPDAASLPAAHRAAGTPPSSRPAADRSGLPAPADPTVATPPPRLEGWAYAFVRPGGGPRGLAGVGQIGGSQAAARIAWRLSPGTAPRIAAAVRIASAIGDAGREAAPGIEIGGSRLRLTVERRIAIDRAGRDAWAGFVSGGVYHAAGGWVAEGYAQAGVVGARRRDPFADGAVRGGRRLGAAIVGAGLWGAAQPGAARIDAGPRFAVRLPGTAILIAAEQRFRLAARARPGSGPAVTIAGDF